MRAKLSRRDPVRHGLRQRHSTVLIAVLAARATRSDRIIPSRRAQMSVRRLRSDRRSAGRGIRCPRWTRPRTCPLRSHSRYPTSRHSALRVVVEQRCALGPSPEGIIHVQPCIRVSLQWSLLSSFTRDPTPRPRLGRQFRREATLGTMNGDRVIQSRIGVSIATIGLESRVIVVLAADTTLATAEVPTTVAGPKA